jgi:NADH-quinone oxidoreductase subunit M
MLYERRHTREIADFGGIAKPMPIYAALFGIVVMSSIGLPMLNGFVGEFLILLGAFKTTPVVAVAATFGVVLAAVYLLWMFRRVMFGPVEKPENRGLIDLGLREKAILVVLLIPIFWIGIYPETFLRRLHPSVLELLQVMETKTAQVSQADPAAQAAAAHLAAAISEGERR